MRIALVVVAAVSLGGCRFAVKHPAVTAGVVVGTIGLGTCELASDDHKACFAISGGAGVGIALITAVALWLGYEDEAPAAAGPDGRGVDPTNLPPAPVFVPTPTDRKLVPEPPPVEPPPVVEPSPPAEP